MNESMEKPVRVVVLTSKDHPYANCVLQQLVRSGTFDGHHITVLDQRWLMPYRSKLSGIFRYLCVAGFQYTILQIMKQLTFLFCRFVSRLLCLRESPFYPYYVNELSHFETRILERLRSKRSTEHIRNLRPDLILSIFSKEIIPDNVLRIPGHGCVNLHPALLPSYRGVSPTFWCLANNERKTGVTMHYVDSGIDTGKMIYQAEVSLRGVRTEHSLYMLCAEAGARMIRDFLECVRTDSPIPAMSQSGEASYLSIPTRVAMARLRANGYSLFSPSEFWSAVFRRDT